MNTKHHITCVALSALVAPALLAPISTVFIPKLVCAPVCAAASHSIIDTLQPGDASSERAHQLTLNQAEAIQGGLGEAAIRLLPLDPPSWDGGSLAFTIQVDPVQQNYLSVRLWGSDKGAMGNLVLYADGKQVGYRRESDHGLLNSMEEEAQAPGRFFYETLPLPLAVTAGKTTIALKIAALGSIYPYATTWEKYQKPFLQPSRGIYKVYTHTNPRLELPQAEKQGTFQAGQVRTTPGPEVIEESKQIVIGRLSKLLNSPLPTNWANLELLAEAYNIPWTSAYKNPAAVERVLREGDNLAGAFAVDPKFDGGWSGAGPLGEAIVRMWPALEPQLDQPFPGPGAAGATRREVWGKALRQSVDIWRRQRRSFTNQAMLVDGGIYRANRGLRLIAPDNALPEARALRYVYEAVGLAPWMDRDVVDVQGDRASNPYRGKYNVVTRKHLSRELGWVGSYGETILSITRELLDITEDEQIRQQLARIQAARLYFRYPALDADGYRGMKLSAEIDNRHSHYPQKGMAYSATAVRESWGLEIAAVLPDDPIAVGVAQRFIADGHYFAYVHSRLKDAQTRGMMRNVEEYAKVKALPPVPYKFPMEEGQPDFVFSDEENAVLAIKHSETRLFVNLYYRAENAVNNLAKVFEVTPTTTRIVTARANTKVIGTGEIYTRPDYIDWIRGDAPFRTPPGPKIHQAWAGEKLPISKVPEGMAQPPSNKFAPYVGRAAFYWLTYGDYLIGLNTTEDQTYELPVPDGNRAYLDLVSKQNVRPQTGAVKVPPLSTVVLYVGK